MKGLGLLIMSFIISALSSCATKEHAQGGNCSASSDSDSLIASKRIHDFYSNYILDDNELSEDTASVYLTPRLIDYLHREYQSEYDGDGLAVWKFRTDYQDGPGASSVRVTSFDSISKCATIHITDMGFPATGQIFFAKDDSTLKMDSIIVKADK